MTGPGTPTGLGTPADPDADITISLEIENTYPGDTTIWTRITGAVVPAPPRPADADALHDWALEHLVPFTGTGRTAGDAFYDVTVTACTDPQLVGRQFAFGY